VRPPRKHRKQDVPGRACRPLYGPRSLRTTPGNYARGPGLVSVCTPLRGPLSRTVGRVHPDGPCGPLRADQAPSSAASTATNRFTQHPGPRSGAAVFALHRKRALLARNLPALCADRQHARERDTGPVHLLGVGHQLARVLGQHSDPPARCAVSVISSAEDRRLTVGVGDVAHLARLRKITGRLPEVPGHEVPPGHLPRPDIDAYSVAFAAPACLEWLARRTTTQPKDGPRRSRKVGATDAATAAASTTTTERPPMDRALPGPTGRAHPAPPPKAGVPSEGVQVTAAGIRTGPVRHMRPGGQWTCIRH